MKNDNGVNLMGKAKPLGVACLLFVFGFGYQLTRDAGAESPTTESGQAVVQRVAGWPAPALGH